MSSGPPSACSSDGSPPSAAPSILQHNTRLREGVQERASARRVPSVPENNRRLQEGVQETASARWSETTDEVDESLALDALENSPSEQTGLEEALKFLPAAIRLNRPTLVARLSAVLLNVLSVENCVVIYLLASQHALHAIETASHHVICKNFSRISELDETFTELPVENLLNIVFSDTLYATEEQVFRAIVRWVMTDLPMRQRRSKRLLRAVRVNRCLLTSLQEMLEHFLVQTETNFHEVVQDRIHWLTSGRFKQDRSITDASSRAGDRNIIFVMGGSNYLATVETLDPLRGSWMSLRIPDPPGKRTWICSMGHKILVLEELHKKWRFRAFDVQTMKWAKLKTPPRYIKGTCKAYFDHHVYVLGGKDPYDTRCYGYDARTNKWKKMSPMNSRRFSAAAACFEGKLYCCGGMDASRKGLHRSFEVLDLRVGEQWSYLPASKIGRSLHSLVSCGRYLWVTGGFKGGACLSAVERYDVDAQQWSFVRSFINTRENPSVCVLDRNIYVIGGEFEETVPNRKVDMFNEQNGEWTDGIPLNTERSQHGSCVVQYLSNADADRYTVHTK